MFGWFKKPSPPPPPDPFVVHIIESLGSNPECWKLQETEREEWVKCASSHPDAVDKGGRTNYDWKRKIHHYEFRLVHSAGTIIVVDYDATDYKGWQIEKPRHAPISDSDSDLLSEAVKKWREYMVMHDLTKDTAERKALDAAMAEVEESLA